MAAGPFTVLDIAKLKLLDGTCDLDTHVFKMALTTSAQALDATFAGTSKKRPLHRVPQAKGRNAQ